MVSFCDSRDCSYLLGGDIFRLIKERGYLNQRVQALTEELISRQAEIERLKIANQELVSKNSTLNYELKELRRKVFKRKRKVTTLKKRGAPLGHKGTSRRRPTVISEYRDIYPDKCDRCGEKIKVYENSFEEHTVEDIELIKKATLYRLHYGYCPKCRRVTRVKEERYQFLMTGLVLMPERLADIYAILVSLMVR